VQPVSRNGETAERQQRGREAERTTTVPMRIETTERETTERLKRDPNPGSGHIIALGRLNH